MTNVLLRSNMILVVVWWFATRHSTFIFSSPFLPPHFIDYSSLEIRWLVSRLGIGLLTITATNDIWMKIFNLLRSSRNFSSSERKSDKLFWVSWFWNVGAIFGLWKYCSCAVRTVRSRFIVKVMNFGNQQWLGEYIHRCPKLFYRELVDLRTF